MLYDHSALGYLIQYLEARDAAQLVRFWLDVSSYQASAATVRAILCHHTTPCQSSIMGFTHLGHTAVGTLHCR